MSCANAVPVVLVLTKRDRYPTPQGGTDPRSFGRTTWMPTFAAGCLRYNNRT
jgi:hypothetical protein